MKFYIGLETCFCSLSSADCRVLYPPSSSGQLRTCITLAGKMFYEEAFCQQLLSVVSTWKEHFHFHLTCSRGPGPPWGGERESLTSMCFSFVKHHTSPCDSHMLCCTWYTLSARVILELSARWGKHLKICERLELSVHFSPEQLLKMNPKRNFMTLHTACKSVNRTKHTWFSSEMRKYHRRLLFWIHMLGSKQVKLIRQHLWHNYDYHKNYFDCPSLTRLQCTMEENGAIFLRI